MAIFEEVDEMDEKNYKELLKRNVEKKYRRGYSQFLAELIKHGVINIDSFMKTIRTIVKQVENNITNPDAVKVNEEYADCLIRIVNAIKSDDLDDDDDNIEEIRRVIKKDVSERIKPFIVKNPDNNGISTKARFRFLNIFEDIEKF
jgi:ribosomal protein S20